MFLATWIIPVLNGMPYLAEALASIQRQTFQNFQVYVWDNGSTDGTQELLKEWISLRMPGRVFQGDALSLAASLRRLVEETQTPFCVRMDADDICEPERLAKQIQFLEENPHIAAVGSERISIDTAGVEIPRRSQFPTEPHDILHATLRAPRLLHPSVTMRRDAVLDIGNYQDHSTAESPYWCEDYDLWLRLLSRHKAAALPEALLRYRSRPDSLSETEMRLNRCSDARRRAWLNSCSSFAGIQSREMAERLWDRRLLFSMPVLLRIARHLGAKDQISVAQRLRMKSFVDVSSTFLRREDFVTRAWLRYHAQRIAAVPTHESKKGN